MKRYIPFFLIIYCTNIANSQDLRVGIFQNPPLIYQDDQGAEAGIFIEILKKVAQKEGWELEYVHAPFDTLLNQLIRGEIDVLPDIAKSDFRDTLVLFNKVVVLPTWGQVFTTDDDIQKIADLNGKKIAYVEGSYYVNDPLYGLKAALESFAEDFEFIPKLTLDDAILALKSEEVDAVVLNRINGIYHIKKQSSLLDLDRIQATSILFAPVDLHFGFHRAEDKFGQYVEKIDEYLNQQQKDLSSFYYELLEIYFLMPDAYSIPEWIGIVFLILLTIFGFIAALNATLQRRVEIRTAQLHQANSETRENEQKLKLAIDSSKAGVFEWRINEDKMIIDENLRDLFGVGEIGIAEATETFKNHVYKDDLGLFMKSFNEYLSKGDRSYHTVDFRMVSTNGEPRWYSVRGKITEWKDKEPYRYLGTVQDIEERKVAERTREILLSELKERNKELKCLYKTSQYVYDPKQSIKEVLRLTVEILPESWQYPSYTCARIVYKDAQLETKGFEETQWSQKSDIMVDGKSRGYIEVCYLTEMPEADEGPFLKEERNLINLLAQGLGDMIDRRKLDEQIEMVETKERERISKELHDGVQQTLTIAAINLNYVHTKLESAEVSPDLKEKVDSGIEKVSEAIKEVRTIAYELDIHFVTSVENLIRDLEKATSINFTFYNNLNNDRLDPNLERNLFRITQEAANNILKYSNASNTTIQLMKYSELAILTIEDDGIGFDVSKQQEGFGLTGIRNRTANINGLCSIDSAPENGTSITIEVPLEVTD